MLFESCSIGSSSSTRTYIEYFPIVGSRSQFWAKEDKASQGSTSKSYGSERSNNNSGLYSIVCSASSKALSEPGIAPSRSLHNQNSSTFDLANYSSDFKQKHSVRSSQKIENGEEFDILLMRSTKSLSSSSDGLELLGKKIQKQQYAQLLEQYKGSSAKWIDPSFLNTKKMASEKEVEWKTLQDFNEIAEFNGKPCFISNKISPEDIKQGQIGDCYMLAPLSALAENDSRVLRIFPSLELNKNGIYMARLIFKGVLQEVVVDDHFPCVRDQKKNKLSLYGCKPANGNQIWPMILEKCWAKLWGSYNQTQSGFNYEVLHSLTGAATKVYLVSEEAKNQNFFQKLLAADRRDYLICASTLNTQSQGIFADHAYTVLSIHKFKSTKLLILRNPWGCGEGLFRANDSDVEFWSQFTKEERQQTKLDFNETNDGIFAVVWEDFTKKFMEITICKVHDDANYLYLSLEGKNNEYTFIDLHTEGGYHSIAISQRDRKSQLLAREKYKQITVFVSEVTTNSQNKLKYEYIQAKTIGGFADAYYEFTNLKAGNYRICILLTEGEADNQESVTFSVYSPAKFGIKQNKAVDTEDFLNRSLLSYARKFGGKIILNPDEKEDVWIINQFIPECTFGLFGIHVGKDSVAPGYLIKAGENQYSSDKSLVLFDSFIGVGKIEIQVKANSQSLIAFRRKTLSPVQIPNPNILAIKY